MRLGGVVIPKVCCAWDMYITMYSSDKNIANQVVIPSVYVTIADGKTLQEAGVVDVQVRGALASFVPVTCVDPALNRL